MNIFLDAHTAILKEFIKQNVRFLLVGGYAVIHYGYRRTTGDMDIWIDPTDDNKLCIEKALLQLNFDIEDIRQLHTLNFNLPNVFTIGEEPARIDVMTHVNFLDFNCAFEQRNIFNLDGMDLPIIHLHHLVLTKMNTGRAKDVADVQELQKIHKMKS